MEAINIGQHNNDFHSSIKTTNIDFHLTMEAINIGQHNNDFHSSIKTTNIDFHSTIVCISHAAKDVISSISLESKKDTIINIFFDLITYHY
jgi:hypothetical protein